MGLYQSLLLWCVVSVSVSKIKVPCMLNTYYIYVCTILHIYMHAQYCTYVCICMFNTAHNIYVCSILHILYMHINYIQLNTVQWSLSNAVTIGTELPWLFYTGGCITRVLINIHHRKTMNINEMWAKENGYRR